MADFEHPTERDYLWKFKIKIYGNLWLIDGHKYRLSNKY